MNYAKVSRIIDCAITRREETGAAALVTQAGKRVYGYGAGLADVEQGMPFTERTICRAYSCTKVATAVACVQLMERGQLDTSWELSRFFPEYGRPYCLRDGKRVPSPPIRIRDLLNMTSGLAYPGGEEEGIEGTNRVWEALDQSIRDGKPMTTEAFARAMGGVALMFPAGAQWRYGSSADVLGAVIEKAADMELAEYMERMIFRPLGMDDTAFHVPAAKRERLAALYEDAGDAPRRASYVNLCIYDFDERPAFQSGGAGLFSTAADYARLGAELSYGGAGVISRRGVDFLRENGLSEAQRKTYDWEQLRGFGYGNLVRCLEDRNQAGLLASRGAFGWDGWTGTYLLCDPAEGLSVTLFLQRCGAGTSQLSRDVVNTVYAGLG